MIDPFHPDWQLQLAQWHASLPMGSALFMLIDGAFVPGVFRQLSYACKPILLFEALPGCNDDTRDVSPFLILYDPSNQSLQRVLTHCEGHPMVSAIATTEAIERLGQRLAAWCVVHADGLQFNFRFPDTRRLPAIVYVLTLTQKHALVGSATDWHYVDRNGAWRSLPLPKDDHRIAKVERAELDDAQFARLISDSKADEIWSQLQYRGVAWNGLPSLRDLLISRAIALADEHRLDDTLLLEWCSQCVTAAGGNNIDAMDLWFAEWVGEDIDV